jgi:5-methylthioadenosine/S-adenosylhomocysteine deaminase
MQYDIAIHNGIILTINDQFEIIENGSIYINKDTIERIEKIPHARSLPKAKKMIDAGGNIIMPGLVNTHTHLPMTIFRGLADDLPLKRWLETVIFPAEAMHITPDNVQIGTRLACAEMMLSGITTCCDGYFLEDEVAQTVADCGLRGIMGQGVVDFKAPGIDDPDDAINIVEQFAMKWKTRSPLIQPSVFCHSPYTCSAKTLKAAKDMADQHDLLFQIHVAETRDECKIIRESHHTSPVGYLDRLGLIDSNCLLVHGIWLEETDISLISKHKATISHNPESNMKLAAGIAPLTRLKKAGVIVGIGTDGCASNNTLDLFQAMDITAKLHKVHDMDSTAASARSVLEMATREGAKSIGMAAEIGSLEVGKKADVIIVDIHQPHLSPMFHPASHLVYAAKGSDVQTVIVNGNLLVRNRSLVNLDLDEIMQCADSVALRIAQKDESK